MIKVRHDLLCVKGDVLNFERRQLNEQNVVVKHVGISATRDVERRQQLTVLLKRDNVGNHN